MQKPGGAPRGRRVVLWGAALGLSLLWLTAGSPAAASLGAQRQFRLRLIESASGDDGLQLSGVAGELGALAKRASELQGPQRKLGALDPRFLMPKLVDGGAGGNGPAALQGAAAWRDREYRSMAEGYRAVQAKLEAAGVRSAGDTVPEPWGGPPEGTLNCPLWVNEKYRLLYVRIGKTASEAIVRRFTRCKYAGATDTCLHRFNELPPGSSLETLWRDYFVFATVRNPLARFVSMYTFMHNASAPGCPALSWAKFCGDPGGGVAHVTAAPACRAAFVAGWPAYKIYQHTLEQARCLATAGGALAVDYLIRTEHLSDDLRAMVDYINSQRGGGAGGPPPLPAELGAAVPVANASPQRGNGTSSSGSSAAERFTGGNAHCLRRAQELFPNDLRLLLAGEGTDALR